MPAKPPAKLEGLHPNATSIFYIATVMQLLGIMMICLKNTALSLVFGIGLAASAQAATITVLAEASSVDDGRTNISLNDAITMSFDIDTSVVGSVSNFPSGPQASYSGALTLNSLLLGSNTISGTGSAFVQTSSLPSSLSSQRFVFNQSTGTSSATSNFGSSPFGGTYRFDGLEFSLRSNSLITDTALPDDLFDLGSYDDVRLQLRVVARGAVTDFQFIDYRVTSISPTIAPPQINAVPLPAAGWMLLAAVGGLTVMRRRSAA